MTSQLYREIKGIFFNGGSQGVYVKILNGSGKNMIYDMIRKKKIRGKGGKKRGKGKF